MKNYINVAPGEVLYRGKVDSFTYDSKTKILKIALKVGTEILNYQQQDFEPHYFLDALDESNDNYIPLDNDKTVYIHATEKYREFEIFKIISEFDLQECYWPWNAAFEHIDSIK